ncbi:MAG: lysine--tRNA ligase [Candidatus Gygaella obscura]|nr:lysine--tRNA ligase [Candidatus Gygaella obscura]
MELDQIIIQRQEKLKNLKQSGLDPFRIKFAKLDSVNSLREDFKEDRKVSTAGRIVSKRLHGKAGFANIKDQSGKIQIYLKKDILGEENFKIASSCDIGDIVGIKGKLFVTHTGEQTIEVAELFILSKSLRPLPEKWHGLRDVETRFRERYVDIISNDAVKDIFLKRTKIIGLIRKFLDNKGYLEVETPMMHVVPGGAAGRPFKTHHNEYDLDLYLRIAPELYLKKLLVAGFEKIYEINRSFRNEGVSTRHNPEFTMLEVYTAFADVEDVMTLTENLITGLVESIHGDKKITYQDKQIDFSKWERISFAQVMEDTYGIQASDDLSTWVDKLKAKGVKVGSKNVTKSFVANLIADLLVPREDHPVFITDLFSVLCPLAKTKPDNPYLSERFELFISGMEVANAYSELNDPIEQKERFLQELKDLDKDQAKEKSLDDDFIRALEYAMPPAGGLGIGIDRLVMLLTDQASIREVILFPLLRPENK